MSVAMWICNADIKEFLGAMKKGYKIERRIARDSKAWENAHYCTTRKIKSSNMRMMCINPVGINALQRRLLSLPLGWGMRKKTRVTTKPHPFLFAINHPSCALRDTSNNMCNQRPFSLPERHFCRPVRWGASQLRRGTQRNSSHKLHNVFSNPTSPYHAPRCKPATRHFPVRAALSRRRDL